jgi:hypothetical protein
MTDHDPEFDAIVDELRAAGLVTIGTDADGQETWTLTPQGEQLAGQLSMSSDDDAAALLDALLEAQLVECDWPTTALLRASCA